MIALVAVVAALGLCVWGLSDLVSAAWHLLCALACLLECLWHVCRR